MVLFAAKCPVSPKAQAWVESSLRWMREEFGTGLLGGEVLLPHSIVPAGTFSGTEADLRPVLARLCARMGAPFDAIDIELTGDDDHELLANVPLASRFSGEAGHYRRNGDRFIVAVSRRQLRNPIALTATLAHEVGHVRLLGENRITVDRADHEQLADLATVFFGLGVFTANAAFEHQQDQRGWRTSHLGYLGETMFGYALAYYAALRGEAKPAWAKQLDTNPRVCLSKGLRFLEGKIPGV